MTFGKPVILFKDGVAYEYRLTFKGWIVALLLRIEEKFRIKLIKDESN